MSVTAGFSVNIRPIWENDRILFSDTRNGLNQTVTYIIVVGITFSFFCVTNVILTITSSGNRTGNLLIDIYNVEQYVIQILLNAHNLAIS